MFCAIRESVKPTHCGKLGPQPQKPVIGSGLHVVESFPNQPCESGPPSAI
jgi:hypothetical protein